MKPLPTLRRRKEIDRVFREGRWLRLRAVAVGIYQRNDEAPTRAAFVAGKRLGTAVRRNRARRRMREALRTCARRIMPGADVVLAARDATADVDYESLRAAIRYALASKALIEDAETAVGAGDEPQ